MILENKILPNLKLAKDAMNKENLKQKTDVLKQKINIENSNFKS